MTRFSLNDRTTASTTVSSASRTLLAGLLIALAAAAPVAAQRSVSQVVYFRVLGQSRATVAAMTPMAVHESGATVASGVMTLTTNESNQKIVASLDRSMPAGATLSAALRAPLAATSAGRTLLDTRATDVVTDIPATTAARLPIEYQVARSASPATQEPASAGEQRVVTYTIIAGT